MKHRCDACGNMEKFYARAVEYHTWLVDGQLNFIEDKGEVDCDNIHATACFACGSDKITRILSEEDVCGASKS